MGEVSTNCKCKKETSQEKYARVDEIIKDYGYKEDSLYKFFTMLRVYSDIFQSSCSSILASNWICHFQRYREL